MARRFTLRRCRRCIARPKSTLNTPLARPSRTQTSDCRSHCNLFIRHFPVDPRPVPPPGDLSCIILPPACAYHDVGVFGPMSAPMMAVAAFGGRGGAERGGPDGGVARCAHTDSAGVGGTESVVGDGGRRGTGARGRRIASSRIRSRITANRRRRLVRMNPTRGNSSPLWCSILATTRRGMCSSAAVV